MASGFITAADSADTAGVRIAVTQVQSMIASGAPESTWFITIRPVVCGIPNSSGLRG